MVEKGFAIYRRHMLGLPGFDITMSDSSESICSPRRKPRVKGLASVLLKGLTMYNCFENTRIGKWTSPRLAEVYLTLVAESVVCAGIGDVDVSLDHPNRRYPTEDNINRSVHERNP